MQRDTRHSDKGPLKSRHPAVQPERVIRYKCAHAHARASSCARPQTGAIAPPQLVQGVGYS
jgi:hypothetical protein